MSRIFTEQWERRKWYLIRSLFNEVPLLSPIPETQELLSERTSPTVATINRPYSPLPDLIIEKEPNRHDEPEEYYQALERKIMKLYRKLFIDTEKSSKSSKSVYDDKYFLPLYRESSTETEISVEEIETSELSRDSNEISSNNRSVHENSCDVTNNEEPTIFHSEKSSTEREEQSLEERSNEIRKKTKLNDFSMDISETSSQSQNNEIIITQALVHHTGNKEIDKESSSEVQNHNEVNNADNTLSVIDIDDNDEHSEHKRLETYSEESNISNIVIEVPNVSDDKDLTLKSRCLTDASSSPIDPEIMRRRETSNNSVESLNALYVEKYFPTDFSTDKIRLETNSVRAMEEADISSHELSIILETSSTSKIVRNEQNRIHQNGDRKRRILAEIPCHPSRKSSKQRKFKNLAIQTSFSLSDNERNWQEIQKHFFEGKPRVFKLCSCNNHICC